MNARVVETRIATGLVGCVRQFIRYCPDSSEWFVWKENRWTIDEVELLRCLREASEEVGEPGRDWNTVERSTDVPTFDQPSRRKRILATVREGVRNISLAELDADPMLLNCLNGTIDLRTRTLLPHNPAQMITRLVGIPWDPEATAPCWDGFLAKVFDQDAEMIRYVQRCIGYSLTGDCGEQVLFLPWGNGANGKSTFMHILLDLCGSYGRSGEKELLTSAAHDEAALFRTRVIAVQETPDGQRLSEAKLKRLTGGDRSRVEEGIANPYEFRPSHKLWITTNHLPEIRETTVAMWRRLRPIPFTVTIPEAERDPRLMGRLESELPGILRWAVEGCVAWQQERLTPPEKVRLATEEYRESQDPVRRFVSDRCVLAPEGETSASDIYKEYLGWCSENGEPLVTTTAFGRGLAQLGFVRGRYCQTRTWKGVALLPLSGERIEPRAIAS